MSILFATRPCCQRAAHPPTIPMSFRRIGSCPSAYRSWCHAAALTRTTAAVAVQRCFAPGHAYRAVTPMVAYVLVGPAISLVDLWSPSTAAATAATAAATAICRARTLSAASPHVVPRVVSCGLATAASPAAAARGMASAAANSWATAGTPLAGGGDAWRPRRGGGRGAAATSVGMFAGGRRAKTGDGGGGCRRGDGGASGSGTPSSPLVAQPLTVVAADEQSPRSRRSAAARARRSAAAKARRALVRESSGSTEEGCGGGGTPLVPPSPGRPVVVPTPAHAVRVSDETCAAVERLLGYRFKSQATLREAMSHASMGEETRAAAGLGARSNERLEWLGDGALLGERGVGGHARECVQWMGIRRFLFGASLCLSYSWSCRLCIGALRP